MQDLPARGTVQIDQSRRYARAAHAAGDPVELVEFPGMGHMEFLDPAHESWREVTARLPRLMGR